MAMALGKKRVPKPLLEMGVFATIWADIDCLAFAFGIPYESQWGHRGFTHSIMMAAAFAAFVAWRLPKETNVKPWPVFAFTFISGLSHPLLDMLTDGGKGIALFWPFTSTRLFFPAHVIPVSPVGGGFLSARGLYVFTHELLLIWAPALALGGLAMLARHAIEKTGRKNP
jgi:inner membrane protein